MANLLDQSTAQKVIDHALSKGADFAELFIEKNGTESVQTLSEKVRDIQNGTDFGVGIRLFYGTKVLYGYSNLTEADDLCAIVDELTALDQTNPSLTATPVNLIKTGSAHPILSGLSSNVALDHKIAKQLEIERLAHKIANDKLSQTSVHTLARQQEIEIFNSEGLWVSDSRHYTRIRALAIATDGNEQSTGSYAPGAMMGWEFIDNLDANFVAGRIVDQAFIKLGALPCPAGKMPVVIDNAFGGVIFHEACGHLLETTSVAKKASVFHDKMGEMIAHPCVSAVDDGTNVNLWGSINIDDEGMPSQKTQLIKDGKLTSFLVDKMGAKKTGYAPTGSGRRESYKFAPTSRMRNTFIEAGEHSRDDIIASVDKGIYCKDMGGGSVSPGTGEFNFNVREAYIIEKGKITKPLKSATLIGSGPQVLKDISMVGKEIDFAAGMCGSISGAVPTTVGQPPLKIDEILVGGQG